MFRMKKNDTVILRSLAEYGALTVPQFTALRVFADRCVQYCNNLGGLESYPFYLLRMVGYLLDDPGYVYVADMRIRAEKRLGPLAVHEFVGPQAFAGDLPPLAATAARGCAGLPGRPDRALGL